MKKPENIFKQLGFLGISLCIACCALPVIGVTLGIGTLAILGKYFEWAAFAAIALAFVFFGIYLLKKRKAPACDIDCQSKNLNPPTNLK
jgi:uncharacterized protein YoxC